MMPVVCRRSDLELSAVTTGERWPEVNPEPAHPFAFAPSRLNFKTSRCDLGGCRVLWFHGLTAVFGGLCRRIPRVLRGLGGNRRQILIEQKKLTTLMNASPLTETHL